MTEHARSLPRRVLDRLAGVNMWLVVAAGFALGFTVSHFDGPWWLAFLCYLGGGFLPVLLSTVPSDENGFEYEMTNRERAVYLLGVLRWAFTPWGIFTQLLQLAGQGVAYVRYRGDLPSTERRAPETELRLPVEGEWTVVNGGVTPDTSHSWGIFSQRYAYDFLRTDGDGTTHAGSGTELADYYAYGEPVVAPAAGTVVDVSDRRRDYPGVGTALVEWRTWDIAGNHVTIEHADGEYSFLAHLQAGSTTVSEGQEVAAGDLLGRCGNSGHSSEPHLHYQLQDTADFWTAAGLAPRFHGVDVERDDRKADERPVYADREGGDGVYLWAGDRVRQRG
ncbi:M23 family metallopeptidase [Halorubrum sp. DM2]|uniref:M23 family metallopeptidase n=1 Tax=Halorubrum sp. DM2 TaxID=2527867 RepID=UPI0024B853FA|nr:M23 family metallopeptidase [Halorubrum sp. DM2]